MCPGRSHASIISIVIRSEVSISEDNLKVSLTVTNKGDEPAENVKPSLEVGGKTINGETHKILSPNDKFTEDFTSAVQFGKPGSYPVIITVDYTDANHYPFTALEVNYVDYKEAPNARVAGTIGALDLYDNDSDKLKVTVKNTEEIAKKVSVRLVTSKEFAVQNRVQEIALSPGGERKLAFNIKNAGGLPGSTYPVFAVISYEDATYHYLNVASGNILVKKQGLWHGLKTPLLILFAVLLVIICLFYIVRLKKSFRQDKQV